MGHQATGRFTEDEEVVGIPADRLGVVMNELERHERVKDAEVARGGRGVLGGQRGMGEEPERPKSVLIGHEDRVLREPGVVCVDIEDRPSRREAPAVGEEEDGEVLGPWGL
jgi:hypothetical protein